MGIPVLNSITSEEYLEMESISDIKHEYYKGEVFAMAGASVEHNKIVVNTLLSLGNQLKDKNCRPYLNDLRLAVKSNSLYTYPDISVICGEIEKTDDKFDTVTNPTVIIEVLSDSTKDYDRGSKFKLYRDILHLRDYILIDATGSLFVEHFSKINGESWVLHDYKEISQAFTISSIDVTLHLRDIYDRVYI